MKFPEKVRKPTQPTEVVQEPTPEGAPPTPAAPAEPLPGLRGKAVWAYAWLQAFSKRHTKELTALGAIVALVIAVGIFLYFKRQRENEEAWTRLSQVNTEFAMASMKGEQEESKVAARAIEDYKRIGEELGKTQATPWITFRIAAILHSQGKHDEAIKTYKQILVEYPQHYLVLPARLALGYAYEETSKPEEAVVRFEEAAKSDVKAVKAVARLDAGRCYEKLGKRDSAERAYRDVVDLAPSTEWAETARYRLACLK